jgi:hypothetical protein
MPFDRSESDSSSDSESHHSGPEDFSTALRNLGLDDPDDLPPPTVVPSEHATMADYRQVCQYAISNFVVL